MTIPLAHEELEVGKRVVQKGLVRIKTRVREEEKTIETNLLREEISVERVTVNRPIDAPIAMRQDGEVLIVPVIEEVLVVQKQLMLKEELHIRRHSVEQPHTQSVLVRREEAEVERLDAAGPPAQE